MAVAINATIKDIVSLKGITHVQCTYHATLDLGSEKIVVPDFEVFDACDDLLSVEGQEIIRLADRAGTVSLKPLHVDGISPIPWLNTPGTRRNGK